jgi:hypothetical protein
MFSFFRFSDIPFRLHAEKNLQLFIPLVREQHKGAAAEVCRLFHLYFDKS